MPIPLSPLHLVDPESEAASSHEPDAPIGINELFRRHAPAIAAVGFAMLQNRQEADDLVQDVFLKAWHALDRLENRADAQPWLMTIAIRLARTRLRRRKLTSLLFHAGESAIEEIAAPGVLPEHRDLVRRLYAALAKLPVEQHIAWVLRYVQEETVEQVAVLCGWSLSTAKRRIQAAHVRLLKDLGPMTQELERP